MNKLFQQLSKSPGIQSNNIAGIKQMMKTFKIASNPNQALQSAINQNPQMKQAMELIQKYGGDPKTTFYKLAQEKGVNPEDILNMLK